jgi:transposase
MLRGIDVRDIHELRRQGLSISAISGLTGFDRKTIRKYLAQGEITPRVASRPQRGSKLDPFKEYIEERLQAGVWNAIVLLREVRARGYGGGYTILKDYLRPKRSARPR